MCLSGPGLAQGQQGIPASQEPVRNVRIWFGQLSGYRGDGTVSLVVQGGGRVMFTTQGRSGDDLSWKHSIRIFTNHGHPIIFEVVSDGLPTAPFESISRERKRTKRLEDVRSQAQILAQGFDDLIGDYELPEAKQLLGPDEWEQAREKPTKALAPGQLPGNQVLCRAVMTWPPTDGNHTLDCGPMQLQVRTKILPTSQK